MESVRKHAFTTMLGALAVVALLALPGRSGAVDYENTFFKGTLTAPASVVFGNGYGAPAFKSFLDHYTFNLSPAASVNSIVATFDLGTTFDILGLNVNLYTSGGSLVQAGSALGSVAILPVTTIGAGSYDLRVSGTITGTAGGTYAGTLSAAAAPIPEPETYALMLAGLGLMGFVARRRKQKLVA